MEKARRRVRSKHSEGEHNQNYLPVLDEVSVHTTPSMFSLVSIPDDGTAEEKEKVYIERLRLHFHCICCTTF